MAKKKVKATKREYWWASRDDVEEDNNHKLHHQCCKPEMASDGLYEFGEFSFTISDFHALSTLRLRRGQCKKINKPRLVL